MSIKLIAIDMDGTLFTPDKKITQNVQAAIKAAKDKKIYVVLCTGRPYLGVKQALSSLNFFANDNYVITYNGALITNTYNDDVIFSSTLNYNDFIKIEQLSRVINVHCHAIDLQSVYTTNKDISFYTVQESYLCDIPLKYRSVDDISPQKQFLKMMMIDSPEILDAGIAKIPAEFFQQYTIIKSERYYLELLNKISDKGNAVKFLAAHLNIDRNDIMAIGDNENDISMIQYAGIGVAMGNAVEKVKNVADYITKSNQEDGVACAIEKFVLAH